MDNYINPLNLDSIQSLMCCFRFYHYLSNALPTVRSSLFKNMALQFPWSLPTESQHPRLLCILDSQHLSTKAKLTQFLLYAAFLNQQWSSDQRRFTMLVNVGLYSESGPWQCRSDFQPFVLPHIYSCLHVFMIEQLMCIGHVKCSDNRKSWHCKRMQQDIRL